MLRGDLGILEARLGEDERLGVDGDLQKLQDGWQVAAFGAVFQLGLALFQLLLQLRDGVAQIAGAVVDRRVAEGDVSLIADGDLRSGLSGGKSADCQHGEGAQRAGADAAGCEYANYAGWAYDGAFHGCTTERWIVFGGRHSRALHA